MLPQGQAPHPGLGTAEPCPSLPGVLAERWEEGSPPQLRLPCLPPRPDFLTLMKH